MRSSRDVTVFLGFLPILWSSEICVHTEFLCCLLLPNFMGQQKNTCEIELMNSGGFLLNNGEGGRAGFSLEQPGIAPGTQRWEKSWCFLSDTRKDVGAGGRRK